LPGERPYRAVILSAISVEYEAVLAHLSDVQEKAFSRVIYKQGVFSGQKNTWSVGVGITGPGNSKAALFAERAIRYFKPHCILFIGVAGGLKDVRIGDVVAATKVYGYGYGKAGEEFEGRPDVMNASQQLVQRALTEASQDDWKQRIRGPHLGRKPRVHVAPIASGDQLLASRNSSTWHSVRTNYSDALAVEMEGHGFLDALQAHSQIEASIIRGISDLIDGKATADAQGYQKLAAYHASAFAFELLAKLGDIDFPAQEKEAAESEEPGKQEVKAAQTEEPVEERTGEASNNPLQNLLQDFCQNIPLYEAKINSFLAYKTLVGSRGKYMMEVLENLDQQVSKLRQAASHLTSADQATLDNIRAHVRSIKLDLSPFFHLAKSLQTDKHKREEAAAYQTIAAHCRDLLANLTHFNKN
jgi:nucleoside phosphorylase